MLTKSQILSGTVLQTDRGAGICTCMKKTLEFTHIVSPPCRHGHIGQIDGKHDDGLGDLRATVEADAQQVVVLAEPGGVVPEHVAHEEEGQHGRGHEVGRLVHGEDGAAVQDHGNVATLLHVPLGLVPVHHVRDGHQSGSDEEGVVDPVVRAALGEEVLGAEDAPEDGQGVVALGFEGEPGVGVHLSDEGVLADLVDDTVGREARLVPQVSKRDVKAAHVAM